jgi:hypothetical protein
MVDNSFEQNQNIPTKIPQRALVQHTWRDM